MGRLLVDKRIFTSNDYWFEWADKTIFCGKSVLNTSSKWVIGLGAGFRLGEEFKKWGFREYCIGSLYRVYDNGSVTLIVSPGGPTYMEILLALASARRVTHIIGVGACGSIRRDVELLDVIVPVASYRMDGLTRNYVPSEYPAACDLDLTLKYLDRLSKEDFRVKKGFVITTASTCREDPGELARIGSYGVLCIECEVSILYVLSKLIGCRATASLAVSDSILEGSYVSPEELNGVLKKLFKAAVDTLEGF